MKIIIALFVFCFLTVQSTAQKVFGTVKDDNGEVLPNASILIKGKTGGTACNSEGKYALHLSPGTYIIECQYVNYKKQSKQVTITDKDVELNFQLNKVDFEMEEVIIQSGGNPANNIIKNAIRMRPVYQNQLTRFVCEVYTKGQLRLRDYPKKFLGQKIDFGTGDTSKNRILYLSETISTYSFEKPNKTKIEVHSSKVSGNQENYGLAAPGFFSLYDNNVRIGTSLNPRGFISPIADNAPNYYKYKFVGVFFEDGRQINRIQVTPKRKFEPLFSGFINIVSNEWRIHSVRLELRKESQMDYLDTLRLEQIYVPYNDSIWVMNNQVLYPSMNFMGISAHGSFMNIYSKFDPNPDFGKKYFGNTVLKYTDSANRKAETYWEETRPVQLLEEERTDYRKKDSLEQVSKNPVYLDSVDREHNKPAITGILLLGQRFSKEKKRIAYSMRPLTEMVSYNIVEGLTLNMSATWSKRLDSVVGRRRLDITPTLRYGFSNKHFNASVSSTYVFGKKYVSSIDFSAGKKVFQFNNASPIGVRSNTLASLLGRRNLFKLYEAWFVKGSFSKGIGDGFTWSAGFEYQDRMPLNNTTDYAWTKATAKKQFTPNYPTELDSVNIKRHQAFSLNVGITWQPNARYVELPDRKVNIGSKWPVFALGYSRTFTNLFGSDVDYSKWRFAVSDVFSLKLAGLFNYRLGMGGFIGNQKVEIPDYQHFNGNISRIAQQYLNTFQILPIYQFSNISKFYFLGHIEHHFNGFITNKIPGFRNLNWHLVTGVNAFHFNRTDYTEVFVGLENLIRIPGINVRVDYYWSFKDGEKFDNNFRIGISRSLRN
jgi:hypothetical protein